MVGVQAPVNSGQMLPLLSDAWRRKRLSQQVEFSMRGFLVQKQSHGLLKNTSVSWKQMYFPFDFLVGGNFFLALLGFLKLLLVDGMFLPHILSSLPCDNTLLTCPPSQLFHSTATGPM